MLVVGLDGATYSTVDEGARTGQLPFLSRMRRVGRLGCLRSVVPTLSPPAWSSFLTGLHPGRHGVLHFLRSNTRDPTASCRLVTSHPLQGRTFLDALAGAGLRVGSLCVPATYPPWDIGGIMVSGYPCPEGRWSTWPPGMSIQTPAGSHLATVAGTDEDGPLAGAAAAMWRRRGLVAEIVTDGKLDCLVVVFSAVDHVQHLYGWEKSRARISTIYREADALLASLERWVAPQTLLMVVSDHGGAAPPQWVFRTKRWLIENGLAEADPINCATSHRVRTSGHVSRAGTPDWVLKDPRFLEQIGVRAAREHGLAAGLPVHLDLRGMDPARSKVLRFRLCDLTEGLVVNLEGRQREGVVAPEDYPVVRNALMEAARRFRDPGRRTPVFREVLTREALFPGAPTEAPLPDVILLLGEGVRAVGDVDGAILEPVDAESPSARGIHSPDGIWGMMGPGVGRSDGFSASILDVAPTVLAHFGIPPPVEYDGCVRGDLLRPSVGPPQGKAD